MNDIPNAVQLNLHADDMEMHYSSTNDLLADYTTAIVLPLCDTVCTPSSMLSFKHLEWIHSKFCSSIFCFSD